MSNSSPENLPLNSLERPLILEEISSIESSTDRILPATMQPHKVEREILYHLQNHPRLKFARLDVHQCGRDSVCLEGFLESNDDQLDIPELIRTVHGITNVYNHVVTSHPDVKPR